MLYLKIQSNTSREAVRWTPATREFIKSRFETAQVEATTLIEKKLLQTDFLDWITACKSMTSVSGGDVIISRLSKIVELSNLTPKFTGTNINFANPSAIFDGFRIRNVSNYRKDGEWKIKSEDTVAWSFFNVEKLYIRFEKSNKLTDSFLANQHNDFVSMAVRSDEEIEDLANTLKLKKKLTDASAVGWVFKRKKKRDTILALLKTSKNYRCYEDVVVTEEYKNSLKKIEEKIEEEKNPLTAKQRRELEARVVSHTLEYRYGDKDYYTYKNSKREPKFSEVKEYEGTLYYANKVDESKLHYAAHILDRQMKVERKEELFFNEEYQLVSIAKSNEKYFSDHSHINDFFGKMEDDTRDGKLIGTKIVMDNAVIHWNTARKISHVIKNLSFMEGYANIDEAVYTDYQTLKKYMKRYHTDLTGYQGRFGVENHHADFTTFLDNLEGLQEMVETGEDKDILEYVKEKALPTGITGSLVINRDMVNLADNLLAYSGPFEALFNFIPMLTEGEELPLAANMMIKEIIEWKCITYKTKVDDSSK